MVDGEDVLPRLLMKLSVMQQSLSYKLYNVRSCKLDKFSLDSSCISLFSSSGMR